MPKNDAEFDPDAFNDDDDSEKEKEDAEKLRQRISDVYKKLSGENLEPVTLEDLLQFMRAVNFNFVALMRLIQGIQLKHIEMDASLLDIETIVKKTQKQLQQFFKDSSMIDDILEKPNTLGVYDNILEGLPHVSGSSIY